MSASFHIWRFSRSKPPDITPIAIEQRLLSGRLLPDRVTCNSIGALGHRDGVVTFCASERITLAKGIVTVGMAETLCRAHDIPKDDRSGYCIRSWGSLALGPAAANGISQL
jgi:hypothetical protein